jgi:CSLREA domain-containing protein
LTPPERLGDDRSLRHRNGIRVGILGVAAAVLLACAVPTAASAQVVDTTVDGDDGSCGAPSGNCTLREAILYGTAEVQIDGVYELTAGDLDVGRDVTIRGTGSGLATIRPAVAFPSRVMRIFSDSEVVMSRVSISGGSALSDNGGGILIDTFGSLDLRESEVIGNTATAGGGIWADGALTVRNSLIVSNVAETGTGSTGGGIGLGNSDLDAAATLVNTTLSDNRSEGLGGGIYTLRSMSLTNVSMVENEAPPRGPENVGKGAGIYQAFGNTGPVTTARNVLLARNINGSCGGTLPAPIDSIRGLLDEPLSNTTCLVTNQDPTVNFIVADAGVGSLANNGGLTRTHALLAGSPAIDRGLNCPGDDQRGVSRPKGGACDIGAYEYEPPPPQPGPGDGPTQPPDDDDDELPPPEAGKEVNALPKSGTVRVRIAGTNRFVELVEGQQIPVGSTVDTTKGRVTIVAAGNQQADFFDGIFRLTQGRGARPLTTLTLVEALSCPRAGNAIAAAKKKKRRLWGDGSGRFRTKGKHSAATVVGTRWLVEDRCKSTLTRVTRGRVSVRDFVKKKTVIVRAGRKYVARAKKP